MPGLESLNRECPSQLVVVVSDRVMLVGLAGDLDGVANPVPPQRLGTALVGLA